MLVLNFFNLASLYFRHATAPIIIHVSVVSGPLAWTFIALFWDGAVMVGAHSLPARILANVAIWMILVFGTFFLVFYQDWAMGIELTILTACKFSPVSPSYTQSSPIVDTLSPALCHE